MREYMDFLMAKISVRKLLPSVTDLTVGSAVSSGFYDSESGCNESGQ